MKILHVVPTYVPAWRYGGTTYAVHALCRALSARGHDVTVFTTNVDGPADSDVPVGREVTMDGVRVNYFASRIGRRLYWSPSMRKALGERMRGFDVAHLHSVFLWPTAAAAREARRCGVPYVLAPRGMLVPELIGRKNRFLKRAWIRFVEARNLRGAAAIHSTSAVETADLERLGFTGLPVREAPNGVDLPPDGPAEAGLGGPVIGYLGRINWKKGLDILIRALKDIPGATLAVAGNDEDGYRARLEALAAEQGVSGRVRFAGERRGAEKWAFLRAIDVFALPSQSENFGNTVLEAMAAGKPVVVSPQVGMAPAVERLGCGWVVERDPRAMAEVLNAVLAAPAAAAERGRRGREAAEKDFGWASAAEKVEAIYAEVLKK